LKHTQTDIMKVRAHNNVCEHAIQSTVGAGQ